MPFIPDASISVLRLNFKKYPSRRKTALAKAEPRKFANLPQELEGLRDLAFNH
jgi:hypothetical protein